MTDNLPPSSGGEAPSPPPPAPARKTEQGPGTVPAILIVVALYAGITGWKTLYPNPAPPPAAVAAPETPPKISIVYGSTYPSCARLLKIKTGAREEAPAEASCGFFPGPVPFQLDKVPESLDVEVEVAGRRETATFQPGAILQAAREETPGKEIQLQVFMTSGGKLSHKVCIGTRAVDGIFVGRVYPEVIAPGHQAFLQLAACAAGGEAGCAEQLLAEGAPQYWEDDPVSPTPLEIAAGKGRPEVVAALLAGLPEDFPAVYFARALLAASAPGGNEALGKLLAHPGALKLGGELSAEVSRAARGAAPELLALLQVQTSTASAAPGR